MLRCVRATTHVDLGGIDSRPTAASNADAAPRTDIFFAPHIQERT
jgi:hypothetical protein